VRRPRYHANDASRDVLEVAPVTMEIADARALSPGLDGAGFQLIEHRSTVGDFAEAASVDAIYRAEISELIRALSGADQVVVNGPGILRFSEKSGQSGALDNSRPARFAHVDVSDATAADFAQKVAPAGRPVGRYVHFNVWRALSAPPQDVPLAVCDARSVRNEDLIAADAVFDTPGKPEWSFEGIVVAHSAAHRWQWFPDMHRDEALVFKTNDSDRRYAHCVPHVAFNNPLCDPDSAPRVSIEMRAIALWFN
jgi:hypothetical protein